MTSKDARKGLWIAFFVLPGLTVVAVVILLPLFMSLFNSLFSWTQLLRGDFIGFANFRKVFFTEPYKTRFFNALGNNAKWFALTMLIQNSLGLMFGYLLSRKVAGHEFFKRIIFIPVLFSIVAVGFLWGLYLRPNGLLNGFLKLAGRPDLMKAWLGDESLATVSIILVNIWRWVGFPSLVFLAAIDNVPTDCLEAAYLDGARESTVFRRIVLPLIVPSITVITVLTIIGSLNVFEQIYTMAGLDGSPNFSTDTIGTLFYRTAFGSVDSGSPEIGIGSAIGVIIYGLTFFASVFSISALGKKEVEL
ncbi:MAG TPA: sugar ABC transporter permease [Rectinemataceae bacterium]|nr:sugar ABC transporter permease [Rectinemataceae bacterium]